MKNGIAKAVWNLENEIGMNATQNKKEYKVAFVESAELPKAYGLTMEFKRQQVMVPNKLSKVSFRFRKNRSLCE